MKPLEVWAWVRKGKVQVLSDTKMEKPPYDHGELIMCREVLPDTITISRREYGEQLAIAMGLALKIRNNWSIDKEHENDRCADKIQSMVEAAFGPPVASHAKGQE